jgi:hypothetical protein
LSCLFVGFSKHQLAPSQEFELSSIAIKQQCWQFSILNS